ncbi:fasciclin domain-containing protein [Chitinophaga solisilvae]|uniref:fasciclin domain-containing protein n=1 Tax=Chitinophaga solisilvae TaxID=1233460 RepID=UPI001370F939|nr:fasciclin domain-containing protein [Chitinophaga solisilvae]
MIHRKLSRLVYHFLPAAGMILLLLSACSRNNEIAPQEETDRSRTGYMLEDNFNFTVCNKLFQFSGQAKLLKGQELYTVLAADNEAFKQIAAADIPQLSYENNWFRELAANAILPGNHLIRKMPLGDNQPLMSASGNNVYVSRYLEGNDTITTINGSQVTDTDVKTGNGSLQVTRQVVQPARFRHLPQLLTGDTTLTLFALAVQHSGLMPLLQQSEYTILAPVNAAMRAKGMIGPAINLTSPDGILATDKAALAAIVQYHILKEIHFLDRIHRRTDTAAQHALIMLNGEPVVTGGNPQQYNATTFTGKNNGQAARIYRFEYFNLANCPAGNGVVHHIDNILLP